MKAIDAFMATHGRAKTLLKLHSSGTPGRPKRERGDILRAAVMLAVAAVDAYFHDKILERITPYLKAKKGKGLPGDLIKMLEKGGGVEKLLGIFYEERPHRHIHTIVRQAQADITFQKPDKIESALRLVGVTDFWYLVALKMRRRTSKKFLRRKLGQYAARRDAITHEADQATGKRLREISRPYVKLCLEFLTRFIKAADVVIDKKTA